MLNQPVIFQQPTVSKLVESQEYQIELAALQLEEKAWSLKALLQLGFWSWHEETKMKTRRIHNWFIWVPGQAIERGWSLWLCCQTSSLRHLWRHCALDRRLESGGTRSKSGGSVDVRFGLQEQQPGRWKSGGLMLGLVAGNEIWRSKEKSISSVFHCFIGLFFERHGQWAQVSASFAMSHRRITYVYEISSQSPDAGHVQSALMLWHVGLKGHEIH